MALESKSFSQIGEMFKPSKAGSYESRLLLNEMKLRSRDLIDRLEEKRTARVNKPLSQTDEYRNTAYQEVNALSVQSAIDTILNVIPEESLNPEVLLALRVLKELATSHD